MVLYYFFLFDLNRDRKINRGEPYGVFLFIRSVHLNHAAVYSARQNAGCLYEFLPLE